MEAAAIEKADEETKWIDDITAAVNEVNRSREEAAWKKPSIYRVPSFVRSHNPDAFESKVVSFGPFHHGAENLRTVEVHKRRALAHFLHRAGKQPRPFLCKLRTILQHLQDSYQDLDKKWREKPFDFLKMMLLDGCFLIEVLRPDKYSEDYAPNDPVFSSRTMTFLMSNIKRDMLLLENQLPLLAIKAILDVENNIETDSEDINKLVLEFLGVNFGVKLPQLASHLLELYRESMLYDHLKDNMTVCVQVAPCETKVIENAVELWESGIRFKSSEQRMKLMNFMFDEKSGCLELPVISVNDKTEYLLLNMVAYEQIRVGISNEITSYIIFMDALIGTEDDVKLLQKEKVIINLLGSHKAVADLFNSLSKEAVYDPNDELNVVKYQVRKYYMRRTARCLAYLRKQYWAYIRQQFLETPWVVVGVIAASIALFLTFIQTLYSVLSFHIGK